MRKMNVISAIALISAVSFTNTYAATPSKSTPAEQGEAKIVSSEARATVKAIDYKTRKVTLQTSDGKESTFVAGNKVKNFDQVKKGDVVVADYMQAVVYDISKGGKAMAPHETTMSESARPGSAPEGTVAREVTASILITAIDKKTPSVTFKNAAGETETFKVKHPERLEGVKVGDTANITYTEALALKVEKPTKQ